MKKLAILGSTGSIGQQTLDIVRTFPGEFQVVGLAAGFNLDLLAQQLWEFQPTYVCCADDADNGRLPRGFTVLPMEEMVCRPEVDLVMVATTGRAGLLPTLRALEHGKAVALANKEVIVMAGELVTRTAKEHGGDLFCVDSEPSAIWQCMQGEKEVRRVIITASGGPFRNTSLEELKHVTPAQALKHPTWKMGKKITIDCATLMNKAFEVIETHWLFDLPWEKIEVVVHPQSTVHSMVEFADGSVKAQLGPPDMHLPIQYALFYPSRLPNPHIPRLDTSVPTNLEFHPLDTSRYPCFLIALEAGRKGGTHPAALSAADEVAVELFLSGRIAFIDIARVVDQVASEHVASATTTLEEIMAADQWARARAYEVAKAVSCIPS